MREIVFALIGAASGYIALWRARKDIAMYRLMGATFGTGSFSSRTLSMPLVIGICSALYFAVSLAIPHDLTALTFGLLVSTGLRLTVIDLDTHLLPRRTVYRAMALTIPLLMLSSSVDDQGSVVSMFLGGLTMWVVLQVCEVLSRGGIGKGDVAFAGFLGLFVGWESYTNVLIAVVAAFLAGGVIAAVLLISRRATRSTRFPFGPFLFFGALLAVLR